MGKSVAYRYPQGDSVVQATCISAQVQEVDKAEQYGPNAAAGLGGFWLAAVLSVVGAFFASWN